MPLKKEVKPEKMMMILMFVFTVWSGILGKIANSSSKYEIWNLSASSQHELVWNLGQCS